MWIVLALVALALLFGATQTEQGRAWLLGLRSMVDVPAVIGQTQTEAQVTLESAGLRVGQVTQEETLAVPPGEVIRQTPAAGTTAKKDSGVDLALSVLPSATVPDVVGETESEAITMLAEEGLITAPVVYVYNSKTKAGEVTAQEPSASTEASIGAAVTITVSKGTEQGQVPNVIGLSQDDANAVITAGGFTVTTIKATSTSVPAGDVMAQSPAAGVVIDAGSTVTITVSTGAPAEPAAPTAPSTTPSTTPTPPAESTPPPAEPSEPAKPGTKPSQPIAVVVEVPNVIGMKVRDAVKALRDVELKVSFAFAPDNDNILKIIKQDPAAGASVDPGTTVVITIGLPSLSLPDGKPTQPMPVPAEEPTQLPAEQPAAEQSATVSAPSVPTTAP